MIFLPLVFFSLCGSAEFKVTQSLLEPLKNKMTDPSFHVREQAGKEWRQSLHEIKDDDIDLFLKTMATLGQEDLTYEQRYYLIDKVQDLNAYYELRRIALQVNEGGFLKLEAFQFRLTCEKILRLLPQVRYLFQSKPHQETWTILFKTFLMHPLFIHTTDFIPFGQELLNKIFMYHDSFAIFAAETIVSEAPDKNDFWLGMGTLGKYFYVHLHTLMRPPGSERKVAFQASRNLKRALIRSLAYQQEDYGAWVRENLDEESFRKEVIEKIAKNLSGTLILTAEELRSCYYFFFELRYPSDYEFETLSEFILTQPVHSKPRTLFLEWMAKIPLVSGWRKFFLRSDLTPHEKALFLTYLKSRVGDKVPQDVASVLDDPIFSSPDFLYERVGLLAEQKKLDASFWEKAEGLLEQYWMNRMPQAREFALFRKLFFERQQVPSRSFLLKLQSYILQRDARMGQAVATLWYCNAHGEWSEEKWLFVEDFLNQRKVNDPSFRWIIQSYFLRREVPEPWGTRIYRLTKENLRLLMKEPQMKREAIHLLQDSVDKMVQWVSLDTSTWAILLEIIHLAYTPESGSGFSESELYDQEGLLSIFSNVKVWPLETWWALPTLIHKKRRSIFEISFQDQEIPPSFFSFMKSEARLSQEIPQKEWVRKAVELFPNRYVRETKEVLEALPK